MPIIIRREVQDAMTMEDREIWREAYSLYDNNKDMPNTYDAWCCYIDKISAFAFCRLALSGTSPGQHARAAGL